MRTPALAALALLVAGCTPARALTIRAADVTPTAAGASFAVTFSAPLKLAAEEDGAAYGWDEFQFEIAPHDAIPRTVVRGGEIPCAGAIPVRAVAPPDTSACAGGWGAELATVPYALSGATVRFLVPWESLGGAGGPFPFAWRLIVTRAGDLTDERRGESPGLLVARTAATAPSWGGLMARYRAAGGR